MAMISYKIINKSKPKCIVLIHGLFANSGYWLPYLKYFKDYKLIVLDIDYEKIVDAEVYIDKIRNIVSSETKSKANFIVSHSLGSLLAALLPSELYDLSVEICPVYCSKRINNDDFLVDMKSRLKSIHPEILVNNLNNADVAIKKYISIIENENSNLIRYFPNKDIYFVYDKNVSNYTLFDGDHFDITNALDRLSGFE